jgi:hypothetical protein
MMRPELALDTISAVMANGSRIPRAPTGSWRLTRIEGHTTPSMETPHVISPSSEWELSTDEMAHAGGRAWPSSYCWERGSERSFVWGLDASSAPCGARCWWEQVMINFVSLSTSTGSVFVPAQPCIYVLAI